MSMIVSRGMAIYELDNVEEVSSSREDMRDEMLTLTLSPSFWHLKTTFLIVLTHSSRLASLSALKCHRLWFVVTLKWCRLCEEGSTAIQ